MSVVKDVVREVAIGVAIGVMYYIVYIILLPKIILAGLPEGAVEDFASERMIGYLYLFIALSIGESLLRKHPVSIPLRILSKLLPALILLTILNYGVITGTITIDNTRIEYRFDISILLYTIILFSLIYGFVDAFSYFKEEHVHKRRQPKRKQE